MNPFSFGTNFVFFFVDFFRFFRLFFDIFLFIFHENFQKYIIYVYIPDEKGSENVTTKFTDRSRFCFYGLDVEKGFPFYCATSFTEMGK